MPTLTAILVASVAGWAFDQALGDVLGAPGLIANLVLSTVVFYVARRWMTKLRDG